MMKLLKFIVKIVVVLSIAVVGLGLLLTFGYLLNPVQREISNQTNQWNELVPLNTRKLTGKDTDVALAWLESKGFKQTNNPEKVRIANSEGEPDWERTYAPIVADAILTRNSGSIACSLRFVVVLDYADNKVEQARGMMYETGCL
ncbi:MAG: hypothetical protein ABJG88_10805 [Litorimonas sp.]